MSNHSPRIVHLKSLLALEEKRMALQEQMDSIQDQISSIRDQLFNEGTAAVRKTIRKVVAKGRSQRGALKARIMAALESAGHNGVRVTELAEALGTKAANLHAWFHATAKRIPNIVKVAGGHYRLNGSHHKAAAPVAPAAKTETKSGKGKARRSGKARRGALSENILTALSEAGTEGIAIKDLSSKVGSNYRNVAVWFATTGKKNPKIKKVSPAVYKLAA